MDRSRLGPGPWDAEADDRIAWHEGPYLLVLDRVPRIGYWGCYVVLTKTSPLFGLHVDDVLPEEFSRRYAVRLSGSFDFGQADPESTWSLDSSMQLIFTLRSISLKQLRQSDSAHSQAL